MDPLSLEAQDLLNRYNLTYDEVLFYESGHQIGKYVSWYRLDEWWREQEVDKAPLNYFCQGSAFLLASW